ncbi:hypothetical protein Hanom_Chr10g00950631 [Helianthus anomalus]
MFFFYADGTMIDLTYATVKSSFSFRPCVVVKEDTWALSVMWWSRQQWGIMGRFSKIGVVGMWVVTFLKFLF